MNAVFGLENSKYFNKGLEMPLAINPVKEINCLCKEKKAIIQGHYYQTCNIQDIAQKIKIALDQIYLIYEGRSHFK